MIYFDNSATTLPDEDILTVYREIATQCFGNPSSTHRPGAKAALQLAQARGICADSLGVKPEEIIFTSSGSESNNTIIKGLVMRKDLHGKHIITTSVYLVSLP